jgi:hypothetical protein
MENSGLYAARLRNEIALRNRLYARGRLHAESYGSSPVIVYAPEGGRHGNFFDAAYAAICSRPDWLRRFDKIHAQARRSLPKVERRWRELDSSMSSDALLMNVFCSPQAIASTPLLGALGVDAGASPVFGWRARVPLKNGRFDRTEVDMRLGPLLVEAKLTEADFQTCASAVVESYRDFDDVFDRELLPRVQLVVSRRKEAVEFPEDYSQEYEEPVSEDLFAALQGQILSPAQESARAALDTVPGYAGYQLIRNVLAASAGECGFCVIHDQRRPDLREAWFQIMAAVKSADLRVRLKVLTWQELAALLPADIREFLNRKYGIAAPGSPVSPIGELGEND